MGVGCAGGSNGGSGVGSGDGSRSGSGYRFQNASTAFIRRRFSVVT